MFYKHFLPVCGLLILLTMSLIEQFLTLMKPSLSIFPFMDHDFGVVSQESSPNSGSFRFSPVLISGVSVIFCLTFRSVISFQLLFVKSIWYVWASQLTQWVKNLPAIAGDLGLIPGLGKSPGGGHGNPLQYSYLESLMDRGAWWATVQRVAKSQTRLNTHAWDM